MIHVFSVWLRTGSNPADINRLQSHNGKRNLVGESKTKETPNVFFFN